MGASYTTGTAAGMDPETFAHSKLILLWGTNPLTSGHHVWKFMPRGAEERRARGRDRPDHAPAPPSSADEHLAPLPGTDAALALGLLHVVLATGAEDREYLAEHTRRLGRVPASASSQFPPERAAAITGLPEERIVALGERLATTRPTAHPLHAWACSATPAAATRCACSYAHPGRDRRLAVPGRRRSYSTSGRFRADIAGALRATTCCEQPVRTLNMTRLGRRTCSTSTTRR